MQKTTSGNLIGALSFFLWGILPLYYRQLPNADVNELLAFRIICSVPFMLLFFFICRKKIPTTKQLLEEPFSIFMCFVSTCLMFASLYLFTWALTNERVLSASLGYFINPIIAILLGVVFLGDKLSRAQKAASVLVVCGITYQIIGYGELPWLALFMAMFFALYGLSKKFIKFDSLTSITLECLFLTPFAIIFMFWQWKIGASQAFSSGLPTLLLYIGVTPATLLPLIFFTIAVRRTSLTMVGLLQYIEPSLQFILAVFLFGEPFDQTRGISFSLIWIGLVLCCIEAIFNLNKKNRQKRLMKKQIK